MTRRAIGTVLVTILVVGALGAIGYGLYQAGLQQGLVENGADIVIEGTREGFRGGWWGPGWGAGLGVFGVLFRFLFLFLFIGLIVRLFFGPRRWGPPGSYWTRGWDGPPPWAEERLTEWHEQAHGSGSGRTSKPERDDT